MCCIYFSTDVVSSGSRKVHKPRNQGCESLVLSSCRVQTKCIAHATMKAGAASIIHAVPITVIELLRLSKVEDRTVDRESYRGT